MKSIDGIGLRDGTSVYGGAPGVLFPLLFGQHLHIGGLKASIDLAERAGIGAGTSGIDLCCGNGAGMRGLVRFRDVASMVGIDASERNVERGRQRCQDERFDGRIRLLLADASDSGLPDAAADFIWGED